MRSPIGHIKVRRGHMSSASAHRTVSPRGVAPASPNLMEQLDTTHIASPGAPVALTPFRLRPASKRAHIATGAHRVQVINGGLSSQDDIIGSTEMMPESSAEYGPSTMPNLPSPRRGAAAPPSAISHDAAEVTTQKQARSRIGSLFEVKQLLHERRSRRKQQLQTTTVLDTGPPHTSDDTYGKPLTPDPVETAVASTASGSGQRSAVPLGSVTKVKLRAGRLLIKSGGQQAKVAFLHDHPFFQGTSSSLRERLAPQLIRRCAENVRVDVLEQGSEPEGSTDYIFLTAPDFSSTIELLLDGQVVAALGGSSVFGQEALFGVTKNFIFGVRMPTDAISNLWVIPRAVLQALLHKEMYRDDRMLLRDRAHTTAVNILRTWYLHPMSHIKIRLFDNAEYSFKWALVKAMEMQLCAAGTVTCCEREPWSSGFCVFRGEANAKVGETKVARLAQAEGTSAWAAWWGILEMLGIAGFCPATVTAATDCIIWHLSPYALQTLRQSFPLECRLFDQVAMEHLRDLQPHALKVSKLPLFRGAHLQFLEELESQCTEQVHPAGHTIVKEGGDDKDMFFLVRGHASAFMATSSRAVTHLNPNGEETRGEEKGKMGEGDCFGELTALGFRTLRAASVVCETHCDLRVASAATITSLLTKYPAEVNIFASLAELHGYTRKVLPKVSELSYFKDCSEGFRKCLEEGSGERYAFVGHPIIQADHALGGMYMLLDGSASCYIGDMKVHVVEAPVVFGEMSLVVSGYRHPVSVVSDSLCTFRVLPCALGVALKEKYPDDLGHVEQLAQARLAALRDTIASMALVAGHPTEDEAAENHHGHEPQKKGWWVDSVFMHSEHGFIEFLSFQLSKSIFFHDELILHEGDEGDCACIIEYGSCVVEVAGVRVGEVKAGGLIGEAVLLSENQHRTATVRAVGVVSVLILLRSVVTEAFDAFPREKARVEEMMHLRALTNKVLAEPTGIKKNKHSHDRPHGKKRQTHIARRTESYESGSGVMQPHSTLDARVHKSSLLFGSNQRRRNTIAAKPHHEDDDEDNDSTTSDNDVFRQAVKARRHSSASNVSSNRAQEERSSRACREARRTTGFQAAQCCAQFVIQGGKLSPRQWANKRREAMRDASMKRDCRLVRSGSFAPVLPECRSYRVGAAVPTKGVYSRCISLEVPVPGKHRYRKAAGVYLCEGGIIAPRS